MCEQCNELKQRIVELERVVIALTSNQRANDLVQACKDILCPPEHHCDEGDGIDWLDDEILKEDEWNRVKTR